MTVTSKFSVGSSARSELLDLASVAIEANTAPVSPALVWNVAAIADRDLSFQDSELLAVRERVRVTENVKFSGRSSARSEPLSLASVVIEANTAPVSPALVWGVAAIADRDLFFQDSELISGGALPRVIQPAR